MRCLLTVPILTARGGFIIILGSLAPEMVGNSIAKLDWHLDVEGCVHTPLGANGAEIGAGFEGLLSGDVTDEPLPFPWLT